MRRRTTGGSVARSRRAFYRAEAMPSRVTRDVLLVVVAATLALAGSAHAVASTARTVLVTDENGTPIYTLVLYEAAAGEVNAVEAVETYDEAERSSIVLIEDDGAAISAGSGCVPLDVHRVRCTAKYVGSSAAIEIRVGDGDDSARVDTDDVTNVSFFGGDGDDTLAGGARADDFFHGGAGADVMSGGTGFARDVVSYRGRTRPITATLDGLANDGERGEADTVGTDIEGVLGGWSSDTLLGNGRPNYLAGGPGGDLVVGAGGGDVLYGNRGNDKIVGGRGWDGIDGGSGNDTIRCGGGADGCQGGPGADVITGGPGTDNLNGGAGNDTLYARDRNRDEVYGGDQFGPSARDIAWIDRRLDRTANIEILLPPRAAVPLAGRR